MHAEFNWALKLPSRLRHFEDVPFLKIRLHCTNSSINRLFCFRWFLSFWHTSNVSCKYRLPPWWLDDKVIEFQASSSALNHEVSVWVWMWGLGITAIIKRQKIRSPSWSHINQNLNAKYWSRIAGFRLNGNATAKLTQLYAPWREKMKHK